MQNQQDIFQHEESAFRLSIQTALKTDLDATELIPG